MTRNVATKLLRAPFLAIPLALACSVSALPAHPQGAVASTPAQGQAQDEQSFSLAQIQQMVAPVARYPDPLLTQILVASTYPLEVIEAARWSTTIPA